MRGFGPGSAGWYGESELSAIFAKVGRGCRISRGVDVIGAENIELGDNVRIDTGALLLAGSEGASIKIASHCHIAARAILLGTGGINLGSFTTVGFGSQLITASDHFGGECLVGPIYDADYVRVKRAPITLEDHAIVTTDCTLLPGAVMALGSVLGAKSLLKGMTVEWTIYAGVPAKAIVGERGRRSSEALHRGQAWAQVWTTR